MLRGSLRDPPVVAAALAASDEDRRAMQPWWDELIYRSRFSPEGGNERAGKFNLLARSCMQEVVGSLAAHFCFVLLC